MVTCEGSSLVACLQIPRCGKVVDVCSSMYTYVITVDGQNIAKQVDKDISGIAALKNI